MVVTQMLIRTGVNWFLLAIVISLLLHAGAAIWWLSQPVQPVEQRGLETVTVDLIALAPAAPEPVAQPVASPGRPEPDVLLEDQMALQHKIVKKIPEKKLPQHKPAASLEQHPAALQQLATVPEVQPVPLASQTSASATAARYDADYLNNPAPTYPSLSRRLGEEGLVVLRVQVSAEGRALQVELKKSSGFERLDNAARKSVEKWRFVPARQAGIAVASWVEVPLQFSLQK
jgi:periplasmic protein TonB